MPRPTRLNIPHIPQHIVQRGNNRQACFFDEKDYALYLSKLKEYADKYHVEIHSYVLMTNHIHLLATPTTKGGVSHLMQSLGRYYVRYINQTYNRTGGLYDGRFKSSLIDSEKYFLTVSRYIELNPVRAVMVNSPEEYPWSSYRRNALGKAIKLITPNEIYLRLGKNDHDRCSNYQSLFKEAISEETLKEIREATKRTWVLGEE